MRILFISHYFFPEGNAPATRVFQLARRWIRVGHKVTVITGVPNVPTGVVYGGFRNRLLKQVEDVEGIRVARSWTYIAPNRGFLRRIANYVSFMVSAIMASLGEARPDVVVATSPQFFCGWAGAVVGWLKRKPFVLEVRDLWPESIVAVGAIRKGGWLLSLLEWLEKRLYGAARHIVAAGDGYRDGLLARGVDARKISVIPNGVDTGEFQPQIPDAEILSTYSLTGKLVCSYVGTIGMACGLDVVLRAAKVLQEQGDERFVFMLVGDGAVREQLEREASEAGLHNMIFTGRQPKERIPGFVSVADIVLVHLRRAHLFRSVLPSKIFEAFAMAKPILLGVEGCAAELVRQSGGGLCFEPENERELVECLYGLAKEAELFASRGRAGRRFVLEHFNRDRQAEEYSLLLEQIAAAR